MNLLEIIIKDQETTTAEKIIKIITKKLFLESRIKEKDSLSIIPEFTKNPKTAPKRINIKTIKEKLKTNIKELISRAISKIAEMAPK